MGDSINDPDGLFETRVYAPAVVPPAQDDVAVDGCRPDELRLHGEGQYSQAAGPEGGVCVCVCLSGFLPCKDVKAMSGVGL